MTDKCKAPETLEEWEDAGRRRFHDEKEPYPTRDIHTAEQEQAFLRGFRLEQLESRVRHETEDFE